MTWQPIETAPKDGTSIDIWAKMWRAYFDDFVYMRFPDCHWKKADMQMGSWPEGWRGVIEGYCPTHWMPLPNPPEADIAET